MTKLFGGFEKEFYESYNYHYPLVKNWQTRYYVIYIHFWYMQIYLEEIIIIKYIVF